MVQAFADHRGTIMHCISNPELVHFLRRDYPFGSTSYDVDLSSVFCDILDRANDFLSSEAGSIFLDDPVTEADREPGDPAELVLIACFGAVADRLVGLRLRDATGIVGEVYRTGRPYRSAAPERDPLFLRGPGAQMGFPIHSVVCAPLVVEGSTIGVIELLNHLKAPGYSESDLQLLGIFAQTISASIMNAIDAQRSKEMAKRDDLTELFNDRYLHHSLSRMVSHTLRVGEDCGLIFLDLDHFKSVNDQHGHLIGSRVLHEVGTTLRQILPGSAVAARYGGDEFVIMLPGAGRQEAFWVAETVRQNIESKVFLEIPDPVDPINYPALCLQGHITCSLGVACLLVDVMPTLARNDDPVAAKNELMRAADTCMYSAKEQGRNRTVTAWEPTTGREHGRFDRRSSS
jgi:diguanylate cyclase (GGDEF)-like protein